MPKNLNGHFVNVHVAVVVVEVEEAVHCNWIMFQSVYCLLLWWLNKRVFSLKGSLFALLAMKFNKKVTTIKGIITIMITMTSSVVLRPVIAGVWLQSSICFANTWT